MGTLWRFCQTAWSVREYHKSGQGGVMISDASKLQLAAFSLSDRQAPWKGRECRARYSQNWLLRVKSSALVTGFVLAEGTHQTRCLFGELVGHGASGFSDGNGTSWQTMATLVLLYSATSLWQHCASCVRKRFSLFLYHFVSSDMSSSDSSVQA